MGLILQRLGGDLAAFASDYEDSPETTFIGREITRGGTQAILER